MKIAPTSTTRATMFIIHKEARGGTNRVHRIKEVTLSTQNSIQINLPLENFFLGQAKIYESLNKKLLANYKTLERS